MRCALSPLSLPSASLLALRPKGDSASTAPSAWQATCLTLSCQHDQPATTHQPYSSARTSQSTWCDRNHRHMLNEWPLHHCRFLPVRSRVVLANTQSKNARLAKTPRTRLRPQSFHPDVTSVPPQEWLPLALAAALLAFPPSGWYRLRYGVLCTPLVRFARRLPTMLRFRVLTAPHLGATLPTDSNPHGVSYLFWLLRRHPSLARWPRSPPSRKRLFSTCPLNIPSLSNGVASWRCNQCR